MELFIRKEPHKKYLKYNHVLTLSTGINYNYIYGTLQELEQFKIDMGIGVTGIISEIEEFDKWIVDNRNVHKLKCIDCGELKSDEDFTVICDSCRKADYDSRDSD